MGARSNECLEDFKQGALDSRWRLRRDEEGKKEGRRVLMDSNDGTAR